MKIELYIGSEQMREKYLKCRCTNDHQNLRPVTNFCNFRNMYVC